MFGPNIDCEIADRFIQEYLQEVEWEWSLLQHPDLAMVQYIISKLKTAARGFDGIPSFAWKFGGHHLAQYILDLVDAFCFDGTCQLILTMD